MNSKNIHPRSPVEDDDDIRPDTSNLDSSTAIIGRGALKPGERTEICIDDAVGYSLRLIPSNKVLARFTTTLDAWPAIIAAIDTGQSPRTLALDAHLEDGSRWIVSAGPRLESFARLNNGEPHEYPIQRRSARRRIAED